MGSYFEYLMPAIFFICGDHHTIVAIRYVKCFALSSCFMFYGVIALCRCLVSYRGVEIGSCNS